MKVRLINFIFSIALLLVFFSSCQEAQLPPINMADVVLYAAWEDYSFHFSADVQKTGSIKIEEQGFVFESPQLDNFGRYWDDRIINRDTFFVSNDRPLEYILKRNYPPGMPCRVFAYVKTNYSNYRSESKDIQVTDQEPPVITSVSYGPEEADSEMGTIYIEGTGFSDIPLRNNLWVMAGEGNLKDYLWFNVVKASSTRIEATYSMRYWKRIGKFPLHLQVGEMICNSEAYFEMKGTLLVSIEPSAFRYGEEVTFHLENYRAGENFKIGLFKGSYLDSESYKITSIADNKIKMRIYPIWNENVSVRFYDKDSKYGPNVPITILNPWQQISSHNWQQAFDEYKTYCSYKGKGYVFDTKKSSLRCYNTITHQWEEYPFMRDGLEYAERCELFGANDYVYLLVNCRETDSDIRQEGHRQELHRFNINSHHWERLNDAATNQEDFLDATYAYCDEHKVYLHSDGDTFLRVYHIDTDNWEKTDIEVPYDTNLVGIYDGHLYYTSRNLDIYRMKLGTFNDVEKVLDGDCLFDNIRGATLKDNYIYFQQKYGMFRVDVSVQSAQIESLGGCFISDWWDAYDGTFFLLDDGTYYLKVNEMYKYME